MTKHEQPDEFGRIPSNPGASRGPQPPLPPHPTRPSEPEDTGPDQEEIVEQLRDSELSDTGPNETLRRHIEIFSHYGPVFKSLGHAVLGAAVIPFAIAFIVFQLRPNYEVTKLSGAILRAAWLTCVPLFMALCLARGLRHGGLAEKHFRWSPILCDGLLKTLNLIAWVWLPFRFFYIALATFDQGDWNNSLGRIFFIAAMLAMTVGLYRTSKSLRIWSHEDDIIPRPHFIQDAMYWFLPLMPLSLMIMSGLGYHFTAVQLSQRVLWTILSMVGIGMIGGLISRLLLAAQFGIKLRELSRNDDGQINSEESIDIAAISMQVNRLLRATALVAMVVVGWQIWANVLPIFDYLNDWHLYPTTIDGVTSWVSVGRLLVCAGIVFITFVLSKNLPGLLEITLLDRLPLDRGGRYAISFVVKYLVAIAGLLAACSFIGFSWSKVQWLAAGLTVGLGFGLQEIFANVISGIIILLERPIRVGDVVTVSGTTGTVSRMQLRATTIMDRDYRELIVPNKKFITEDVMNWTLTDLTSRVIFKIGVAYGSDTQLVHNTLLKVARRHPLINAKPEAEVVFESFGDSTLNFELRVFIPNREVYAQVLHELNMAINEEFGKKDIEIAFPQQDIYIKNLGDLPGGGNGSGMPQGGPSLVQSGGAGGGGSSTSSSSDPSASNATNQVQQQLKQVQNDGAGRAGAAKSTDNENSGNERPKVIPFRLRDVQSTNDSVTIKRTA